MTDLIDVNIEKLVYGGEGLARLEGGKVAFVPYVLPGERLSAETVSAKGGVIRARPLAWQVRSPERETPLCPLFSECGGCHYQHIPYERELAYKRDILRESLERIAKIRWEGSIETVSADEWGYRNRTQLRIGAKGEVGFLAAGSRRLVGAERCDINSAKLNQALETLRGMTRQRRFPRFLKEVEFFTNETDVQMNVLATERPLARSFFDWCAREIDGFAAGDSLEYPGGGFLFRVGARSFFQVNRLLIDKLVEAAVGGERGRTALDLYAGVGLLTLPLAKAFERVIGVDSSLAAVRSLQFNAERAGLNVRAAHLNVDRFLAGLDEQVDLVVADPPRSGLGRAVTAELLRLAPTSIVLVSCDPSTLARDLTALLAGGYAIESLRLIDLFPRTYHLETIVRLTR